LNSPARPRVAVVGGGWSGLAAAVALCERADLTLYEAAPRWGGRARRVEQDGVALDNGQHILLGAYRDTLTAIKAVGGDPAALFARLPLELNYPGRMRLRVPARLPAPLHLAGALLAARGLTWRDKLAIARLAGAARWRPPPARRDVAAWLADHRQTTAARRLLWEPLCVAALNTHPTEASARVFATVLRDALFRRRADSDLLIPRADLGRVYPDLAVARLERAGAGLKPGVRVRALAAGEHGVNLTADRGRAAFDAVICALPPHATATILREEPRAAGLCAMLDSFAYEPIVTCYLWYPPGTSLPAPMIGLDGEIAQWAFDRGRLDGSDGLVAVVVSAAGRLHGHAGDALATAIDAELRATLPGLPAPLRSRVIAERRATYRCAPGRPLPPLRAALPGVYLAGDHMVREYPATLEAAVRAGAAAARAVVADLGLE
jgi:squalene-associated FAD-dependent desaturase